MGNFGFFALVLGSGEVLTKKGKKVIILAGLRDSFPKIMRSLKILLLFANTVFVGG